MGKADWHQDFCADPFVFVYKGIPYLFYETLSAQRKGVLGCFSWTNGQWKQLGLVLEEPWHLSYPQVFEDNGALYMIPESSAANEVMLYISDAFPTGWQKRTTLLRGNYADTTLLKWEGRYYLFAFCQDSVFPRLELWMSEDLLGPWSLHPQGKCLTSSPCLRRPAGSCFVEESHLWRVAQDCDGGYGKRVFKVMIEELSPTVYREGGAFVLLDKRNPPHQVGKHTFNRFEMNGVTYVAYDSKRRVLNPWKEILKTFSCYFVKMFRKR
ncbi:MAG: hypothetical protein RR417_03660 [Kiritimatiellia bacterium]